MDERHILDAVKRNREKDVISRGCYPHPTALEGRVCECFFGCFLERAFAHAQFLQLRMKRSPNPMLLYQRRLSGRKITTIAQYEIHDSPSPRNGEGPP